MTATYDDRNKEWVAFGQLNGREKIGYGPTLGEAWKHWAESEPSIKTDNLVYLREQAS